MSTETTPLAPSIRSPGPSYVFPGVPPRSRRYKMERFQYCLWVIILGITIAALIIALNFSSIGSDNDPDTNTPLGNTTLNGTDLFILFMEPIPDEPPTNWTLPNVSNTLAYEARQYGIRALGDRELLEESLSLTPVHSPSFRHYRSISTTQESRKISRRGYVENHATLHVARRLKYIKPKGRNNIGNGPPIKLHDPTQNTRCKIDEKYRRSNGTCNNPRHQRHFGAAMIPYRRSVAPDYDDGISSPRVSKSGKELPSARKVSLQVHRTSYATDSNFTVMLAVFGQFLDHDITATALSSSQDGESINCCTVPLSKHPECFPVPIEADDPFYIQYNTTCMNFVRSAVAPTGIYGPRQQLNQATAFIDGSVVYGSTDEKILSLRARVNGTLRMFRTPDNRELLPISTNPDDGCNQEQMNAEGKYCFESGDDRSNENLLLTSMHLLFARHHNYLARGLQNTNPHWSDEIVYQEARKILGAQIQHVAYNEFLPILLGKQLAKEIGITSNPQSKDDTYDGRVDPSIDNSFAAAAFRFAHTLLPGLMQMTSDKILPQSIALHKMLFNPFSLWAEKGLDQAIETSINNPVSNVDRFFTTELTEKLFQNFDTDPLPFCGLDLVSLNIQRGRDHGLPGYSVFREHCGLSPVRTWDQMEAALEPESLKSVKAIYESAEDVDLYTGALSEPPLEGAIFGPVLTCIVADQFLRLKRGDAFWYERKSGPQKFLPRQLKEIYKTSLASIICRNSDAINRVQTLVMERDTVGENMFTDCDEIKNFNFTPWKENVSRVIIPDSALLIKIMEDSVNASTPRIQL